MALIENRRTSRMLLYDIIIYHIVKIVFFWLFPLLVRHVQPVFFERSFIYAAPTLWNQLSIDIRMLEFNQFKSRVKTELYLKYFEP